MKISLIAALGPDRLIGRQNALPWQLPADLRHFKKLTMGHPIVMGRKTHESIGRPLPGRQNIVISRQPEYRADGCTVAHSLSDALAAAKDGDEVFIIGGAAVYQEALPRADRLHLTLIEGQFEGDTFFPDYDPPRWHELSRDRHEADPSNPHAHTFLTLERVPVDQTP